MPKSIKTPQFYEVRRQFITDSLAAGIEPAVLGQALGLRLYRIHQIAKQPSLALETKVGRIALRTPWHESNDQLYRAIAVSQLTAEEIRLAMIRESVLAQLRAQNRRDQQEILELRYLGRSGASPAVRVSRKSSS
jgi:hypothetical protein